MCGIAGKISAKPFPLSVVQGMSRSLAHRGPDDAGIYAECREGVLTSYFLALDPVLENGSTAALAHRRLSILDRSRNGHQPMPNEDGTIWLVFNGEIYNAADLRAELKRSGHCFRSQSDSEVLLHGYEEWGKECLLKLNGMFAFALWCSTDRSLFCARDPLGIKPLYYRHRPGEFTFASEIKSLLYDPGYQPSLDPQGLSWYLTYSFPVGGNTWFSGIQRLLPGHALYYRDDDLKVWMYYRYDLSPARETKMEPEAVHYILKQAVASHLISDIPICFHLSGGLDSSGIVALAQNEIIYPVRTFSGRFDVGPDYDERPYIEAFRNRYPTLHDESVPDSEGFAKAFAKIIWHMDEPTAGPGSFPQFCLSRLIRMKGYQVACTGHGGDELFGGYPWYLPSHSKEVERSRARRLKALSHIFPSFVPDNTRSGYLSRFEDPLNALLTWDVRYYLPALLQVEDRMSMAWSVESRVPYLDSRVVEMTSRMSISDRVKDGVLKASLREALTGILPSEITARKDKMGFPTPFGIWVSNSLEDWIRDLLLSKRTAERGMIDPVNTEKILERHLQGEDWSIPLWQAANVELWSRIFLEGEIP